LERGINCHQRQAPVQPNLWWLAGDRFKLVTPTTDSQN
jgi:hypothetical protein